MEPADGCEAGSNEDKSKDDSDAKSEKSHQSAKIEEEEKVQDNAGPAVHIQDRISDLQGQDNKNNSDLVIRVIDYKCEQQKSAPQSPSPNSSLNESDFKIYALKYQKRGN